MRKFVSIIAALGFLGTTSLTPVFAAPMIDGVAKSDDLSAAKKKKKAKKAKKKMSELAISDVSAAKKKKKKAKKKKMSELTISDLSSAKKKKAKKKAKKKMSNVIEYRIAA